MRFKFIQTSLPCCAVPHQRETNNSLLPFSTLIDRLTFNNSLHHEAGVDSAYNAHGAETLPETRLWLPNRNPLKIKERSEAPVSHYPVSLRTRQRLHPFSHLRVPETIERSVIVGTELFHGLKVLSNLSSQHFSTDEQFRLRIF